jgi:hypothetical protein
MTSKSRFYISELDDGEIALWDDWVLLHFNGNIYYKMGWLRAMEQNSGLNLKLFVAWPENGNAPLALFPLYIMKKFTLNAAFSPPPGCDIPYLGPLYNNKLLEDKNKLIIPEIQSAIISHFRKIGINFMKFRTFRDKLITVDSYGKDFMSDLSMNMNSRLMIQRNNYSVFFLVIPAPKYAGLKNTKNWNLNLEVLRMQQ